MEKVIVTPHSAYDTTRQLHYKLIHVVPEKGTPRLLLTVWGETEKECNENTAGVMEKMSK